MRIGVGLPTTVADVTGEDILAWARGADDLGFSTVGVLDRLAYRNYEPLATLAAAAAVTSRARLATTVLLAAYRDSAAVLAKQLLTLDRISGGRLTIGIAAGGRRDDFDTSGAPFGDRGRRLDRMLADMKSIWAGERYRAAPIGPEPVTPRLPLLVGGHSAAALRRAARYADGWIAGSSSPGRFPELARRAREAWSREGRPGDPTLTAITFFSLGARSHQHAARYLDDYYGFAADYGARTLKVTPTSAAEVRTVVAEYEDTGCDELLMFPCQAGLAQLELLAAAVG